jgi:SM-20-related protein
MDFAPVVERLVEQGWYAGEGLLPREALSSLAKEARESWQAGQYHTAGIGHDHGHRIAREIRGDTILWVDASRQSEAMNSYRETVEALRLALNRELFLGLESFEIQFARYAEGAHYDRHIDRFSDRTLRTISCVLYLNEHWKAGDGGELRLHLADGSRDVQPRIGTWVIFRSEMIEHEVRPAIGERFSLTGWFRRRALNPLL